MSTWLTYLLPIILFLVCAFFLADQMNLDSAMKKVAEACSPREVPLKVEYIVGFLPLAFVVLGRGVWSIFAYRLWYSGLGLPVAVFLASAFIFLGLPIAFLLAGAFIAFLLEEQWPRFYKDRVKLMLARQKEKYAKAGDTKKEEELRRILVSWDMPASPPPPPMVSPAGEEVDMRNRLQRLENAKDAVLDLLNSEIHMDEDTRKTWVSDAKEVYYTTFAASQALTRATPSPESAASSGQLLGAARSRMERAASELKELKDERAVKIEAEMRAAFEDCWHALCARLPDPPAAQDTNPSFRWPAFFEHPVEHQPQPEKDQVKPPEKRVVKVNDRRYDLPCSICEETASVWEIGAFKWGGADYADKYPLVYRGVGGWAAENPMHASKIFDWFDRQEVAKVRAYTREQNLSGFDIAYCPECDRTYCAGHYLVEHEVDSDDYEQDFATCPSGHRRAIWRLRGLPPQHHP